MSCDWSPERPPQRQALGFRRAGGQGGQGEASLLAPRPARVLHGVVVLLGRVVAGWVQGAAEAKGRPGKADAAPPPEVS